MKTEYLDTTANQWIDIQDGASPLSSVLTLTTTVGADFGKVVVSTTSTSFEPITVFQMRTTYTSTDSITVNAVLVDSWQLTIRANC